MRLLTISICLLFTFNLTLIHPSEVCSQIPANYFESKIIDSARTLFGSASIPLITDFEKDGKCEIVAFTVLQSLTENKNTNLDVIDSDGKNYRNFPKGFDELPLDFASGDLNGDGFLEVVVRFKSKI